MQRGNRDTMAEFIKTSLFVMLVLQFAAPTEQLHSFTVRDGDEVTLPCENVIQDQENCGGTTWLFDVSRRGTSAELIGFGQIGENATNESDRLSLTENCSLVIKSITAEDVGRYTCRQIDKTGNKQGLHTTAHLSVVTMTEHKDTDVVTLNCSVSTYERCRGSVKWLYSGGDVVKNKDVKISESPCFASLSFLTSSFIYESRLKFLKCEVTDADRKKFTFSLQPSGEKPGKNTKPPATKPPATKPRATKPPATKPRATKLPATNLPASNDINAGSTMTASPTSDAPAGLKDWRLLFIIVSAVSLAALLIFVVIVIRWKRTKGNKTQTCDSVGLNLNPAETQSAPETGQGTADPEDGVSYATISYTKRANSKDQVRAKNADDESDAVTYMMVKASDPDSSSLYASVKKPNKTCHQTDADVC